MPLILHAHCSIHCLTKFQNSDHWQSLRDEVAYHFTRFALPFLQSDSVLFESLRRLQLMELSVEVLMVRNWTNFPIFSIVPLSDGWSSWSESYMLLELMLNSSIFGLRQLQSEGQLAVCENTTRSKFAVLQEHLLSKRLFMYQIYLRSERNSLLKMHRAVLSMIYHFETHTLILLSSLYFLLLFLRLFIYAILILFHPISISWGTQPNIQIGLITSFMHDGVIPNGCRVFLSTSSH